MSRHTGLAEATDPVARLRDLGACAVSDALDALGLPGAALGLHSVTGRHRLAGRAVTVDLVEAGEVASPRHLGTAAIDASGAGDVIVVAHHGRRHVSGWGGVLGTGAARALDIASGIREAEEAIRAAIEGGASLTEARAANGYHTLQTRKK